MVRRLQRQPATVPPDRSANRAPRAQTTDARSPAPTRAAVAQPGRAATFDGPPRGEPVLVATDFDDTLRGEFDPDFKGRQYPGAKELFAALDAGPDGRDVHNDVHLVTARDGHVRKAEAAMDATGIAYSSISYGNVFSGAMVLLHRFKAAENQKVEDIETLLTRNPGHQAVLFGDTVQADSKVFRRLLEDHPDRVAVAMLHEPRGFPAADDLRGRDDVVIFRDYAEAAKALLERGLISAAQCQGVVAAVDAHPEREVDGRVVVDWDK